MKDMITVMKDQARSSYLSKLRRIDECSAKHRRTNVLALKLEKHFPGCRVTRNYDHSTFWYNSVSLYLTKDYNITKDVMLFLEAEQEFLSFFGRNNNWESKDDQSAKSLDFSWGDQKLYVYYEGGNCTQVKVGEKARVVKEDIYEIVCN